MQNGKSGRMIQFNNIYQGKKVFLTGHTGFKGSWLALWLSQLGANVTGYSLVNDNEHSHFDLLKLGINSVIGNIMDRENLSSVMQETNPDIIFHLAAQPLVKKSYSFPIETFETNILGTVNVLESSRKLKDVKAIVNITSDKCYENAENDIPFKETDRMGGFDPYSASKGASELITNSYRNSFFNSNEFGISHNTLIASARSGNVIGGGDWSDDRLIPDIVRASSIKSQVVIRNPDATRPWQHVLEPLSGYLLLGQKLLEGEVFVADGWNFGPDISGILSVESVLKKFQLVWNEFNYKIDKDFGQFHEAKLLRLDCTKAKAKIDWQPLWGLDIAVQMTAEWYKRFYFNGTISTFDDLSIYQQDALEKKYSWIKRN